MPVIWSDQFFFRNPQQLCVFTAVYNFLSLLLNNTTTNWMKRTFHWTNGNVGLSCSNYKEISILFLSPFSNYCLNRDLALIL